MSGCRKRVFGGSYTGHMCRNKAVMVGADSKPYCAVHNPERVAAKREERTQESTRLFHQRMAQAKLQSDTLAFVQRIATSPVYHGQEASAALRAAPDEAAAILKAFDDAMGIRPTNSS